MLPYSRQSNKYFAFPVVASDHKDLFYSVVAIIAGTQGDIKVTTVNDDIVTFKNTNYISCQVKKIWSTGTIASELTGIVLRTNTLITPEIDDLQFLADQDSNFVIDQDSNEIPIL